MDKPYWERGAEFLVSDPELRSLKDKYHTLTGRFLPGWNWDEYQTLDDYVNQMRIKVKEAESASDSNV